MKRIITGLVILTLGLSVFGFMGVSDALAGQVCPPGTAANADIGECASCANGNSPAKGCLNSETDPADSTKCLESTCDLVTSYIDPAISLLAALVGVACVISIISAGIQYTTSAGDPQKVAAAKSRLVKTIIAFLAFTFLYAFLQFIIPGGVLNPGG